jgi:tRNA threonylcarbamoyladenosine biosynthesis protein TsaE
VRLESNGPEDTEEIGFRLGKMLRPGDVVAFYGDLGTGKTTMIRGIARAFGIDRRDVTSASFTIIAEYQSEPPFYHIDLYRMEREADVDAAGVWECIGGDSVAVIEWAEKLGERVAENFKKVKIEDKGDDRRKIVIEGINEEDWHSL